MLALELVIVVVLIVANGALALSELAVVSARPGRLKTMKEQGSHGAAVALALAADPGRFLSTVQVGITLVGVLAGAFSGNTLGQRLAQWLTEQGLAPAYAGPIGIGVVVFVITYLSVIVGELVPKQLALRSPERLAALVAPAMATASRVAGPLVVLLDLSGRGILRALGVDPRPEVRITDEEIRVLIAEAESAGVIEPEERTMIAGVMRLGDRPVRAVMTPRREVDLVDITAPPEVIVRKLRESIHSRLPASNGSPDEVVGVLQAKDLLNAYLDGETVDPRAYVREAPIVPDTVDALDVVDALKNAPVHMALVHDEYGHFQGIVTIADIVEAITGEFRTEAGPPEAKHVQRADGSWLLAGDLAADEMAELLGIRLPPSPGYHTMAGFMLAAFGHIPEAGEEVVVQGWRFEVIDLDGRRIDKVLAQRVAARRAAR
jgi:putative hemolysin